MHTHKYSQSGMIGHTEILIVIVVVGIIGFAGWRVLSKDTPSNTDTQQSVVTQELHDTLPADLTDIKSIDEIQTIAAGDGLEIVGIELETDDNRTVYVVHYSDGSTRAYDAKNGTKLSIKDNDNDEIDDSKTLPAGFVAGISIQEAVERARAQQPDAVVRKVELEVEDGVVVYSVRFKNGSRVDLSAVDGSVTRVKQPSSHLNETSDDRSGAQNGSSGSSDDSGSHNSGDGHASETNDSGNDSPSDTDDSDEDDSSGGDDSDDDNGGGSGSNSGHGGGHN